MRTIPKRFAQDPEWSQVEDIVIEFITPLRDISNVDMSQPATQIKAQIMANKKAYEALEGFARSSGILRPERLIDNKPNIFR